MDTTMLKTEIQQFITSNIGVDFAKLALQKNPFPEVNWIDIINQINSKTKAKDKLPTFFSTQNLLYPNPISIEQTSSEKTAQYKSEIVNGKSLIDLTGGFGVDTFYFAKKIDTVVHCEINEELSKIVAYNFNILDQLNVTFYSEDSNHVLSKLNNHFDWIFVDPSRRTNSKGKVFMLKDCLPNVPDSLDFYFKFTNAILLKTAPILDLTAGILELSNVKKIHIVAVENEVKELLWEMEKNYVGSPLIKTVNLSKNGSSYVDFVLDNETNSNFGMPKKFLYEPNSALMKSGLTAKICTLFNVEKLQLHSHLFTSSNLISFPGRTFTIDKVIHYDNQSMKSFLANKKANVTTRNFPETVEQIRKKWKITDGGDLYCFFTTNMKNDKIVIFCTKLNSL